MSFSSRLLIALLFTFGRAAMAAAPQLYSQPAYESPVRGDPDDLLMLAGYGLAAGDEVIYRAISDTTQSPPPPTSIPTQSSAETGTAPIVSLADVPYSVTIRLPIFLHADRPYALWVRTAHGEWSNAVKINDARPFWFTPIYAYATGSIAFLPRELKVIGRNLRASPERPAHIRLVGPQTYEAAVISDERSSETMSRYVARVRLPDSLAAGRYRVEFSRDGVTWLEVRDQTLEVRPDPAAAPEFSVADPRFGGCRPDDGADDTQCIVRALAAAKLAGGGVVSFGPGTWDIIDGKLPGVIANGGIVVPDGVQLRGAGSDLTRIQRHAEWNARGENQAFTLIGHTIVTGFTFRDLQQYGPRDRAGAFFQVGDNWLRVAAGQSSPSSVAVAVDIVITRNTFDKPIVAIADGGLPIDRLFITYNTFGAYYSALELGGNPYNMVQKYRVNDSIIDHNVFKPGSKLDLIDRAGTLASEIGAGQRLDFSDNTADGSSTEYLNSPDDPRGWRAAFFWNLNGSVEQTLVAQNTATCTGDKIGDGEAIAYDNNGNTFAFASAPTLEGATSAGFTVATPLATRQNNRNVPVASYYIDHWVQIISGPGLGQVRKITGYSTDTATGLTIFRVAPKWDVVPVASQTRIAVGREFWQVYTLDNLVDHRQPQCRKSNRSRHDAGSITLYAQGADSVIEGNRQYDTSGILLHEGYIVPEHPCPECTMNSFFQSFIEIRSNTIDGEYAWGTDCSSSGIVTDIVASPWNDAVPPTVGFGVAISHNTIRHADAPRGGAIAQYDSWYAGPEPHRWPLSDNMLIHHNSIEDVDGAGASPVCGSGHARIGINFPHPGIAWRSVLYANSCLRVSQPIGSGGVDTVRVCPSSATSSCECKE